LVHLRQADQRPGLVAIASRARERRERESTERPRGPPFTS
jgi:hypothetical protein